MFNEFYSFRKANIEKPIKDNQLICIHNYTFRANLTPYIVKVEQYTGDIFIIKFFRKIDSRRKHKYNVLTHEYNCAKIITTCMKILISILEKNEFASFGFLGSNIITKQFEEPKENTKRFRVYKRVMENLIGDKVFVHSMDLVHSTYLMVNRKNELVDLFIEHAKTMFDEIFSGLTD